MSKLNILSLKIFKSVTIDVNPITASILKILDPIIFPIEISSSDLYMATSEVTSSGKLVPIATKVRPITLSDTPKYSAKYIELLTNNSDP